MNQTALAALISQCVLQLLERNLDTRKNATEQKEPQYKPYDNAYFFILFVMLFYSFLALTVFFGYVRSKKAISKKDPYQEFIEDRNRNKKWNMTRVPGKCSPGTAESFLPCLDQQILFNM
uniref:Potassium voltage-gated channel subfamily E member 3 n=1 Tax=Cairina moschata TaxID=8855 RepID=A0A8C3GD32_CAIMO